MKNTITKIFAIFAIILVTTISSVGLYSVSVHAADTPSDTDTTTTQTNGCENILGFNAWNCGIDLNNIDSQAALKSNIWIIAANVATDIAVAAAYLIIGYVIYGGYQYTFSGGDPSKVASGKKTLAHAFIGLAIVMSANIIMGAIRIALVGGSGNIGNCVSGGDGCVTPENLVANLIGWVITVAGIVSAVFLVYGGIQYVTSSGDPSKVKKAKDTILYSLIGLAIVALATAITAFVSNIIRDANNAASYNQTIISKEIYDHQIH